jgi:hypothetical protein
MLFHLLWLYTIDINVKMLKNVIYIHIQNKAVVAYSKVLYQHYCSET